MCVPAKIKQALLYESLNQKVLASILRTLCFIPNAFLNLDFIVCLIWFIHS